jgi:GNAT superfamily N-acetyltransferase
MIVESIIRHVTPSNVAPLAGRFVELYGEAYTDPPYSETAEQVTAYRDRLANEIQLPGFDAVVADADDEIVGFAYGYTFDRNRWWQGADPEPADLRGQPKFAVMEWVVAKVERGRGTGRALLGALLANRTEPVATLCANPQAPARRIYESLGWREVAHVQPPGMPMMDVLITELRQGNAGHPPTGRERTRALNWPGNPLS